MRPKRTRIFISVRARVVRILLHGSNTINPIRPERATTALIFSRGVFFFFFPHFLFTFICRAPASPRPVFVQDVLCVRAQVRKRARGYTCCCARCTLKTDSCSGGGAVSRECFMRVRSLSAVAIIYDESRAEKNAADKPTADVSRSGESGTELSSADGRTCHAALYDRGAHAGSFATSRLIVPPKTPNYRLLTVLTKKLFAFTQRQEPKYQRNTRSNTCLKCSPIRMCETRVVNKTGRKALVTCAKDRLDGTKKKPKCTGNIRCATFTQRGLSSKEDTGNDWTRAKVPGRTARGNTKRHGRMRNRATRLSDVSREVQRLGATVRKRGNAPGTYRIQAHVKMHS